MASKRNNISLTRSTRVGIQEKTLKRQSIKALKHQNIKPLKSSFYFSPQVMRRLDEAHLKLKILTKQRRISRSNIVESALIMALENLSKEKRSSILVSILLNRSGKVVTHGS